jgi:putative methionine-R-sulfoxide reductase with GAF domain
MGYLTESSPTLWERLTIPHQNVNTRYRSRARTLSGFTLTTIYVGVVAAVGLLAAPRTVPWLAWATFGLVALCYAISRTPWPQIGAWLLTYGELGALFAFLVLTPAQQVNPQMLIFAVVPALLGTLVLMPVATVVLSVVTGVGITVMVTLVPWLDFDEVMIPYIASLVISGLAASTALIRTDEDGTHMGERNRSHSELESDIWQMAAAAEVASALMGMRELDALLREAARECVRQFELTEARIYLLDERTRRGVLARRAEVGIAVEDVAPTQQAIVRDEALIAPEDRLPPGAKAAIALPMRSGGRALGMLDLRSDTPGAFSRESVGTLQAMADQIAASIENTRLYEAARDDLRGIERLAATLASESSDPADARAPSEYSIPLKVGDETVGVIDLAPGEDGTPPDEEMRRLVEMVARRVTEALETGAYDQPGGEIALRDEALSRFSTELQAATDVDQIMTVAVREASRTLGTGRAFITLSLQPGQGEPEG